jgi:ribosomal protein S18 acetylase RimI-like enzyme
MAVGDRRRVVSGPLRVSTWRNDERTALLAPLPDRAPATPSGIRDQVATLAEQGVERVVTSALGPAERAGFVAAGFAVHERLHLLSHDLATVPASRPGVRIRRARPTDRPAVLEVDHRAFQPFWQLDDLGLSDAIDATPISRFRVTGPSDVIGYAVWGRARDRGYLQRLAVDPVHHREGLGTALVADGLRWLRRHRVRQVVVNTQEGNDAAVATYLALGFRLEPEGLAVMALDLRPGP